MKKNKKIKLVNSLIIVFIIIFFQKINILFADASEDYIDYYISEIEDQQNAEIVSTEQAYSTLYLARKALNIITMDELTGIEATKKQIAELKAGRGSVPVNVTRAQFLQQYEDWLNKIYYYEKYLIERIEGLEDSLKDADYYDDDNDGWTNGAEMLLGTSVNDERSNCNAPQKSRHFFKPLGLEIVQTRPG